MYNIKVFNLIGMKCFFLMLDNVKKKKLIKFVNIWISVFFKEGMIYVGFLLLSRLMI